MNILFVYSANSPTQRNKIVEAQANSLINLGLRIDLFPIEGKGILGYLKNAHKLSIFIRSDKFDIIHAHYGLSGIVSFFAKKNESLVVSFMGSDLIGARNKNILNKILNRTLILLNITFARLFYNISIVKSKEMAYQLIRNTKYVLIPNGVSFDKFYPIDQKDARDKLGIDNTMKIVLFVSDPSRPEKNYSLALQSSTLVKNHQVTILPVFNHTHEELLHYYNSADALILTSFHEGSPNVVKEAMACNCPVVSTRVGDVEWLFGDSPGHFLINFDTKDVAEKIELAIEFRKNVGQTKGRERISSLGLESNKTAQKIKDVYLESLAI